ncbi:hypothetical protein F4819DRAFT_482263 [Hypoxylon fuscum]|nr:hypothetical protein F4819DRAFT_482263 [Hypoxylon fuscum]
MDINDVLAHYCPGLKLGTSAAATTNWQPSVPNLGLTQARTTSGSPDAKMDEIPSGPESELEPGQLEPEPRKRKPRANRKYPRSRNPRGNPSASLRGSKRANASSRGNRHAQNNAARSGHANRVAEPADRGQRIARPLEQIVPLEPPPQPAAPASRNSASNGVTWNAIPGNLLVSNQNGLTIANDHREPVYNQLVNMPNNTMGIATIGPESYREAVNHIAAMAPAVSTNQRVSIIMQFHGDEAGGSEEQIRMDHSGAVPDNARASLENNRRHRPAPESSQATNRSTPESSRATNKPESAIRENIVMPPPSRANARSNQRCGNCHKHGHVLRECVGPWSPSGDIPGCYRCNVLSHTIDQCPTQPPYKETTRYFNEVHHRVGLPPLRSEYGWNFLAIDGNHKGQGPISRETMKRVPATHFENWDYRLPASEQENLLVKDPATANLDQIKALPNQGYVKPVMFGSAEPWVPAPGTEQLKWPGEEQSKTKFTRWGAAEYVQPNSSFFETVSRPPGGK